MSVLLAMVVVVGSCSTAEGSSRASRSGHDGTASQLGFEDERCRASRVHYVGGDFSPRIPWIRSEGSGGRITGHLFYYSADEALGYSGALKMPPGGRTPSGNNVKVLWLVDGDQNVDTLEVTAINLSRGRRSVEFGFPSAVDRIASAQHFPSVVDIPEPGCWELRLEAGSTSGQVVVEVVPPSGAD
ncbi:MAG: hypothetical protein M3O70_19445 [Actinomycetota bacterium]|nr:hypothetical protein [Actinomycetota bacterium]